MVVPINLSIALGPLIAAQQDKFPIDNYETSAWFETCFGCSNGIASAGHEPGARFVSGSGLVDEAVEFQP